MKCIHASLACFKMLKIKQAISQKDVEEEVDRQWGGGVWGGREKKTFKCSRTRTPHIAKSDYAKCFIL